MSFEVPFLRVGSAAVFALELVRVRGKTVVSVLEKGGFRKRMAASIAYVDTVYYRIGDF